MADLLLHSRTDSEWRSRALPSSLLIETKRPRSSAHSGGQKIEGSPPLFSFYFRVSLVTQGPFHIFVFLMLSRILDQVNLLNEKAPRPPSWIFLIHYLNYKKKTQKIGNKRNEYTSMMETHDCCPIRVLIRKEKRKMRLTNVGELSRCILRAKAQRDPVSLHTHTHT